MARVKLGITTIDELAAQNYLRADDLAAFRRAYDFLLRVRNDLHFMSTRATDVMNLDLQPRIAQNLGYTEAEMLPRVEHFMQDYYRAAQTIFRVSKLVEDRLALSIGRTTNGEPAGSFRERLRASASPAPNVSTALSSAVASSPPTIPMCSSRIPCASSASSVTASNSTPRSISISRN
jgi:[protein-PII] uridylyltransferase